MGPGRRHARVRRPAVWSSLNDRTAGCTVAPHRGGGASIPVVVADLADVPATGPFRLVYVVWNSLFNLTSQARQIDCFGNVAKGSGARRRLR